MSATTSRFECVACGSTELRGMHEVHSGYDPSKFYEMECDMALLKPVLREAGIDVPRFRGVLEGGFRRGMRFCRKCTTVVNGFVNDGTGEDKGNGFAKAIPGKGTPGLVSLKLLVPVDLDKRRHDVAEKEERFGKGPTSADRALAMQLGGAGGAASVATQHTHGQRSGGHGRDAIARHPQKVGAVDIAKMVLAGKRLQFSEFDPEKGNCCTTATNGNGSTVGCLGWTSWEDMLTMERVGLDGKPVYFGFCSACTAAIRGAGITVTEISLRERIQGPKPVKPSTRTTGRPGPARKVAPASMPSYWLASVQRILPEGTNVDELNAETLASKLDELVLMRVNWMRMHHRQSASEEGATAREARSEDWKSSVEAFKATPEGRAQHKAFAMLKRTFESRFPTEFATWQERRREFERKASEAKQKESAGPVDVKSLSEAGQRRVKQFQQILVAVISTTVGELMDWLDIALVPSGEQAIREAIARVGSVVGYVPGTQGEQLAYWVVDQESDVDWGEAKLVETCCQQQIEQLKTALRSRFDEVRGETPADKAKAKRLAALAAERGVPTNVSKLRGSAKGGKGNKKGKKGAKGGDNGDSDGGSQGPTVDKKAAKRFAKGR